MALENALRGYPFRLLTTFAATFPKGTASAVAGNFTATPKGSPLGELASAARLKGYRQNMFFLLKRFILYFFSHCGTKFQELF